MNNKTLDILDYNRILDEIAVLALTSKGKETIRGCKPSSNKKQVERMLHETDEAVKILKISASVPIHSLDEITSSLEQAKKGMFLRTEQLTRALSFFEHCRKLKRFMLDKESVAPVIATYALSISHLSDIEDEIARSLRHGQIDDYATQELAKIRRHLRQEQESLKNKAEVMSRSKKITSYLQESMIVEKNGRYVLPIKKQYRNKVSGTVIDTSASGATVFMEPKEVADIQDAVNVLKLSEEHEMEQILYTLTGIILENEAEINIAMETMHHYDVIFAKAKYCREMEGNIPKINEDYKVDLIEARHPMLGKDAVPLSLKLEGETRALVITGPNTGGKTVTLKTVGLLTLMAQTGLLIPADEGSEVHLFQKIYVDMGDGQSIDENLSTFSSRMGNIIHILEKTDNNSLVLLDELGSGTDPSEGMGLAQVIMEQLFLKGATLLATTHYRELKGFAEEKKGFINGSMEFDLDSLQPTYRLLVGETGNSQAFDIALKLGLHPDLVKRAYELTNNNTVTFPEKRISELNKQSLERQIAIDKYGRKRSKVQNKGGDITIFEQGDNVRISAIDDLGIVYQGPDDKGNYVVQVKGEKTMFNHKRLSLYISARELYPEGYDFDIVFKSKEYRKKKHLIGRKFIEGLSIDEEQ
ncbi:endonuclease MutS2 [Salipaludibacillus daqingensis]|uniref:endonuclease MutS2 n=1 Tax=Salipaludibacillus daqingensis TaxID=3041001 RepID=UPI0024772172|nr:endonuclease MutS2 [Salipaludibacillus daqingensis]